MQIVDLHTTEGRRRVPEPTNQTNTSKIRIRKTARFRDYKPFHALLN